MASISDIALVTQVTVLHNKQAFDQLVRKYQSPVRRFFLNQTLGDEQLSDDLAQETFIKAYVNLSKFRAMSSFSTWLMRIAIMCSMIRYVPVIRLPISRMPLRCASRLPPLRQVSRWMSTPRWRCSPPLSAPVSPFNSSMAIASMKSARLPVLARIRLNPT